MGKKWNITGYAINTVAGTESNFDFNTVYGYTESKKRNWTKCIDSQNLQTIRNTIETTVNRALHMADIDFKKDFLISLVVASNFFENVLWERNELNTVSDENDIISYLRDMCHVNGLVLCNSTACSSGGSAIVTACHLVDDGKSEIVIVLGYDMQSESPECGMKRLGALSRDKIAPFSLHRTGTDLADGIGCMIIEKNNLARRKNASVYASIVGFGVNCDGYNITSPDPEGKALMNAMQTAIVMSGIQMEQIGYINAHGSGTHLNDVLETKVIKNVFHQHAYHLLVNSSKSIIGHTLGAAGVVEAIITIMELNHGVIHPTANYIEKDSECDLNYCFGKSMVHDIKYAISNSIGFGGINVCLLIERGIKFG